MGNILIENGKAVGVISKLPESVSVTADGVKTYAQLLSDLANIIDYTKVTNLTMVETITVSGYHAVFKIYTYSSDELLVENGRTMGTLVSEGMYIKNNDGRYYRCEINSGGTVTITNNSSIVPQAGTIFKVCY